MEFRKWLENIEAARLGIRDTVLSFLKDKVKITDDTELLDMPLNAIQPSVLADLLKRGIVTAHSEDISFMIRNGTGTVGQLIDSIAGSQN